MCSLQVQQFLLSYLAMTIAEVIVYSPSFCVVPESSYVPAYWLLGPWTVLVQLVLSPKTQLQQQIGMSSYSHDTTA